jgi:hypothetical protein
VIIWVFAGQTSLEVSVGLLLCEVMHPRVIREVVHEDAIVGRSLIVPPARNAVVPRFVNPRRNGYCS